MLGLHPQTLRNYAEQGKIPHYRNSAGQRLYDVDAYLRGAIQPPVDSIAKRFTTNDNRQHQP